ncbi:hypothetical protein P8C59_008434 [Phyllachora maydis]|nr:hypothetical protein P8C59_008434 [Phyllachora maydis]
MTAWWNWAGWVCVVPGVQQGATGFVLGALEVAYPHRADLWGDAWFGWALTAAGLVVAMLPNLLPQRALKLWLRFAVGLFFGLLALYWTWFPAMAAVGGHHFQTPAGVFGRFHNGVNTGGDGEAAASDAYCWTVGLLFGAWVFYGYDTSAHLAEETHDASATVAKGMWLSTLSAWALSVPTLVLVLFCIQDFPALLAAPYANNFTAYLVQLLGPRGAVVVLALLAANATCGSASCFLSAQRVTFAISRDGVLPGSRVLRRLTRRHRVPAAAALLVLAVALVVASAPLALGSAADVAMAAVAAAATAATNLSYLIPLAARYTVGRAAFRPAPALRLGRAGSWLLAPVAAAWIGFLFVVLLLPQRYPVSARSLNYAPVCVGIVAVASVVGWVAPWGLGGRYWFAGPRRTLGDVVDAGEDVLT